MVPKGHLGQNTTIESLLDDCFCAEFRAEFDRSSPAWRSIAAELATHGIATDQMKLVSVTSRGVFALWSDGSATFFRAERFGRNFE